MKNFSFFLLTFIFECDNIDLSEGDRSPGTERIAKGIMNMKKVIIALHQGSGLVKYQNAEALQNDLAKEAKEGSLGLKTMYTWPINIWKDHETHLDSFLQALDDLAEASDHLTPAELGLIAEPVGKFMLYFFSPSFLKKGGLLQ